MNMDLKIIKKRIDELKNTLSVEIEIAPRNHSHEPKIKVFTKNVIEFLSSEYKITNALKEDVITNIAGKGFKRRGVWVFELPAKTTKKSPAKTTKKSPVKTTKKSPAKTITKKASTSSSIRDRMKTLSKK